MARAITELVLFSLPALIYFSPAGSAAGRPLSAVGWRAGDASSYAMAILVTILLLAPLLLVSTVGDRGGTVRLQGPARG